MATEKISTTLLRFATIRKPEPVDQISSGRLYKAFDAGNFSQDSVLYESLSGIMAQTDKTANEKLGELIAEADDFTANAAYLSSNVDLEAFLPGFYDFGVWLKQNRFVMTTESITQNITHYGVGAANTSDIVRLWDNLFCHLIRTAPSDMVQRLTIVFRAAHFLSLYQDTDYSGNIKKLKELARVTPKLPSSIFPIPKKVLSPPESNGSGETSAQNEAVEAASQSLAKYKLALQELQLYRENQRELRVNIPNAEGSNYAVHLLTTLIIGGFTNDTQSVLSELAVIAGMRIDFGIARIEKAMGKAVGVLMKDFKAYEPVLNYGGAIWRKNARGEEPEPPENPYADFFTDGRPCHLQSISVSDLRRIEMKLCTYVPGEIGHIENILAKEYKERVTQYLRRKEQIQISMEESETTTEKDTQTSDRFEMEKEMSKTVQNEFSAGFAASISGKVGVYNVGLNTNLSYSHSSQESENSAVHSARSLTERVLERVVSKTREERISKMLEEWQEKNTHGFDNRGAKSGKDHVVGIYRWVDKIYDAYLVNYGKRMLVEVMVTEPGAYHLWAVSNNDSEIILDEPKDPRTNSITYLSGGNTTTVSILENHSKIDRSNYAFWASTYGIQVDAPPDEITIVVGNKLKNEIDNTYWGAESFTIKIPEGYTAETAYGKFGYVAGGQLAVFIGKDSANLLPVTNSNINNTNLNSEVGEIPITVTYNGTVYFMVHVEIECKLTDVAFEQWQLKTYNAIIGAYKVAKADYDQAVRQAKSGFGLKGTNPAFNKQIIEKELKKHCIHWLFYGQDYSSWAVYHNPANIGEYSEMPVYLTDCGAIFVQERAKFMENAFDWALMVYELYPYFWGARNRWKKLYNLNDDDPLFLNFLQAGMAKVVIPVKRGYEKAVLHFLSQGTFSYGLGDLPAIDSPIYESVMEEMAKADEMEESMTEEPIVEKSWQLRVPTTLTVVQGEAGPLTGNGLVSECEGLGEGDAKFRGNMLLGQNETPPENYMNDIAGDTGNNSGNTQ